MKQIQLILQNDLGSIRYQIDAEAKIYSCGSFDAGGHQVSTDESGPINDPQKLATRLYLMLRAVLLEQA